MSNSESRARSLAHQARISADLAPDELRELGGWLLDTMARLIVMHDDRIVAMELRLAANEAFDYGALSKSQQRALGRWVETEVDVLRACDRRNFDLADRRASNRVAALVDYVATVKFAGFCRVMGRGNDGYSAAVAQAPFDDIPAFLLQGNGSKGPTLPIALRKAMRQVEVPLAAE